MAIMTVEPDPGPHDPMQARLAMVTYGLLGIGGIVFPLGVIGFVIALIQQGEARPWVRSHFHFQVRTALIALLFWAGGVLAWFFLLGWLVWLASGIWYIGRCITGFLHANAGRPHPDPDTWGWA